MARKYALLDRDGTIIRETHYLASPDQIELLPGAVDGLRRLQQAGYGLIVITNQSAVRRGYLSEAGLADIHAHLERILQTSGVHLDAILYCPHVPEDGCSCRKPLPGMVERAMAAFHFSPDHAIMIGDKPCDIQLGRRCGTATMLVRSGYGRAHEASGLEADYVCDDLSAAADLLLQKV